MEASDELLTIAELAIGLAGFSGVVIAFAHQGGLRAVDRFFFIALISIAGTAALLAFVPGVFHRAHELLRSYLRAYRFAVVAFRILGQFSKTITPFPRMIQIALKGAARPRRGPLILGNWEVLERLGATDAYTEYRAVNESPSMAG